jgi:hypothetical protein
LEGFRRLNTIKAHSDKTAYFRALITKAIFALSERDCALQWRMPAPTRQKITFAEMRASGVRGLLVYCADYQCSHWTAISGDRWPNDVRLSDIEPLTKAIAAIWALLVFLRHSRPLTDIAKVSSC